MTKLVAYTKKERVKDAYLKRTYGISLLDYYRMLDSQDRRCAICLQAASRYRSALAVDHNHKTGKVRGLLCYRCNKFVVGRHTLRSAAMVFEYMLKYEGDDDAVSNTHAEDGTENVS